MRITLDMITNVIKNFFISLFVAQVVEAIKVTRLTLGQAGSTTLASSRL